MRLINVRTLDLEEFLDVDVPTYAILSHTWSDGEVSLRDWSDRDNRRFKPGYSKIISACQQAEADDLEYLWVDTNCIDKTSSAELSEAINSMYKWYKRAHVCYAYLSDVPFQDLPDCKLPGSAFRASRWFTRGWTLQELIAPSNATGVGLSCLIRVGFPRLNPLKKYSVAQRLSWASSRSTTRVEDQAYCLLGLFDISMPLVYGEGTGSFTRLLEEIIRKYPDQSFLASSLRYVDFLPSSPKDFAGSCHVMVANSAKLEGLYTPPHETHPFHMTNIGLLMKLPLIPTLMSDIYFAALDCWDVDWTADRQARTISRVWIPLRRIGPRSSTRFTRLLWPHVFVSVRLIGETGGQELDPAPQTTLRGPDTMVETPTDEKEEHKTIPTTTYYDLVGSNMYADILIKKPFSTLMTLPQWAGPGVQSPFLVTFPRGLSKYRIHSIFSSANQIPNSTADPVTEGIPLIFPRMLKDGEGGPAVSKAVIVFKTKKSRPPVYFAIAMANVDIAQGSGKQGGPRFLPTCTILSPWSPAGDGQLQDVPVGSRPIDEKEDVMVTVQSTPCTTNSCWTFKHRPEESLYMVLVQIVLGNLERKHEIKAENNRGLSGPAGRLKYMGRESSDDEEQDGSSVPMHDQKKRKLDIGVDDP